MNPLQGFGLHPSSCTVEKCVNLRTLEGGATPAPSTPLPRISRPLLHWFTWYCHRYVRSHFHSLRISRNGLPSAASGVPLVIYTNHGSWWDPLVGLLIKDAFFADRTLFAPIDAAMLARYGMFAKLGFFGVEQNSRRGAAQFLRTSEAILQSANHLLAITPQSRFADVRERPVRFHGGLGHLATRIERAQFLPVATEFVFWEERLPEILVRFGQPLEVHHGHAARFDADYWTRLFEQQLEATQDALSIESKGRDPGAFQQLLRGGAGQGGIYDAWRALQARLRGRRFTKHHGTK